MKFEDLKSRITGISTAVFGVSWTPPESECAVARRVITMLEDRRILYAPLEIEIEYECVDSALKIREKITDELGALSDGSGLIDPLRSIRAACRRFLDDARSPHGGRYRGRWGPGDGGPEFFVALGALRQAVGLQIAVIALKYGLDVEDELASILPAEDEFVPPDRA